MVRRPSVRARSPNRRSADQYLFLHVAWQKRCGEAPRRPRNGRSHQSHKIEDPSVITPFRALTVRSAALLDVVLRSAPIKCDRREKRHDGPGFIEPRARGWSPIMPDVIEDDAARVDQVQVCAGDVGLNFDRRAGTQTDHCALALCHHRLEIGGRHLASGRLKAREEYSLACSVLMLAFRRTAELDDPRWREAVFEHGT